jgi:ABC-type branched-subunit amino acid transport system ATPase component/ABC-type branched-subunit amino acid transport system permease subunit
MSETLVLGTIHGLTIGLLAVGLVLVYKANRFINLAHAQLGALSAVLLAKFVIQWDISWWLVFPGAVAVGALTGLVVERFVMRPLRAKAKSTEMLLLVSIGVSQLLLALVLIPAMRPNGDALTQRGFPLPFRADVKVGGVILNADSLMIVVLVPVLIGGLALFLRYSLMGKMIRAVAANHDAARLCGVPIGRVSAVTWGLAGAFSAVTAVLLAPSQPTFDAASLGPELLLLALGAAAFGGFVSIPAACVGGLALGLVQQFALYVTEDGADALLVVFVAILLVFFVRARVINATASGETSTTIDRAPLRIPRELADVLDGRMLRWLLAVSSVLLALIVPHLPYFSSVAHQFELTLILVYALVGVALTLVMGWAGQVSLGHFALVGVGAFITARLSPHEWSLPALVVVAGLAGAALLALIGLPAVRLRGLTMAVTTLGLAVVAPVWLFRQSWFGSESPIGAEVVPARLASGLGTPDSQLEIYHVALVVLALVLLACGALRRSVGGRQILAVRDNEAAAAAFGITPATIKLALLALSGFVAGAAGVLWAQAWQSASVSQFDPALSLAVLAVPVIGGLGSLGGAVAGAALLYAPTYFLSPYAKSLFGEFGQQVGFQLALGGAGLVGMALAYPSGVAGAAQRATEAVLARVARRVASRTPDADAAAPAPLVVEGVQVSFGGLRVLDDTAIRVEPGEVVGLIGPNGAGKTTLLNVISGVLVPDAGSVRVFGEEVVDLSPEFRAEYGLARSFQNARLFPGLTVTETVQLALTAEHRVGLLSSALGAPWARDAERETRREAQEIIERLNLTPWADVLTADLSTGTRRICDLAAQLAARPKLIVLDEPTAGVAQREVEMFPPILRRIRDELGCSILIVEHDMPMLMSLCDRVYAMVMGAVIAEGTPEQIRQNPLVVASYLGTDDIAINRSGAKRRSSNGRRGQLVAAEQESKA